MSAWSLMAIPFLECLVLVGIHSYLGIHVIKRKVIFVDLALAQIAALGAIVAFLFGIQPHERGAYVFSLLFTFLGAGVFSLTRLRSERVPQEAVIGLVYALAAAVAILVIDRAPHGAEHIKEILTGNILWVKPRTVVEAAIVYSVVGIFHYIHRDKFLLISNDPQEAYRRGLRVRLWDFAFYMSFGLVITHSVQAAGVLLVFVFLVVPAILAILLTDRLIHQLLIGWGAGALVSLGGLAASYRHDLPSGPAVVSAYGLVLLLAALVIYVARAPRRRLAATYVGAGVLVVAALAGGFTLLGRALGPGAEHGQAHAAAPPTRGEPTPIAGCGPADALASRLDALDAASLEGALSGCRDVAVLEAAGARAQDDGARLAVARRLVELDEEAGERAVLAILSSGAAPLFREEALELLAARAGGGFGYDARVPADSSVNREALRQLAEQASRRRETRPRDGGQR